MSALSSDDFLLVVKDLRPDLHRYCARMTGSASEGEDVVQDTLVRAHVELAQLRELPALRAWLFRIAHRLAIDLLRRRRYAGVVAAEEEPEDPDTGGDAEAHLAARQTVQLALARFAPLPPAQRAAVILKDVLDESLEEIALVLETTVPAVKAALHRGRARLAAPPEPSPVLVRYAERFNARDWDAVRAMLVEDVKLDLVSREKRRGIGPVSGYFANYAAMPPCHLEVGFRDGRAVLLVRDPATEEHPRYLIELTLTADADADGAQVSEIRDFRYAHPSGGPVRPGGGGSS